MQTNAIKLTDSQVDEISIIDHNNPYRNGQRAKDKKTFSRFRYNGTVFTVDSENPFVKEFSEGNVDSVKLIPGERTVVVVDSEGNETEQAVPTFTFDSFVSFKQTERRAEHKAKLERYKVIANAPVTTDLLNDLANA